MIIDPHYDESMTLMVRGMSPSEDSAIRAYTNHKSTCAACFTNDPQRTLWCPTGSACARALASFYIVGGNHLCFRDDRAIGRYVCPQLDPITAASIIQILRSLDIEERRQVPSQPCLAAPMPAMMHNRPYEDNFGLERPPLEIIDRDFQQRGILQSPQQPYGFSNANPRVEVNIHVPRASRREYRERSSRRRGRSVSVHFRS